ncbi:MAG: thioredoxin domain-containing protein [Deltaproteobacteria bacterium]|nr:thioredoxin domain-containing protein [Deltaproteobacteria bacterium]
MKNRTNGLIVLRWRIAFLIFTTVGACLSADLVRVHVKVHTDSSYHSYCAISEWANCETVAASDFAVLFGLPLAVWGLLAYLTMGALAVWGLRRPLTPPSWPFGLLFLINLFSSIGSVLLYFVCHFIINSLCVVCIGVYFTNLSLLAVSYAELRRIGLGPFDALYGEIGSILKRPLPFSVFGSIIAAVIVLLWSTVPAYWRIDLSTGPEALAVGVTSKGHPWIGASKPKLTIEEYSDYQCPFCQRGHDEIRKLIKNHAKSVRLVHRHYPLDHTCNRMLVRPFHPFSCDYAKMAYCAQKQHRFWEANDFLFQNGRGKAPISADELAKAVGIDVSIFMRCLKSGETLSAVEDDLRAGRELRIRGTPTFVIGERIFPGRIPSEVLDSLLND